MNVMAVMRVRHDTPQSPPASSALPNDGRARSRSSAHTEAGWSSVNVSSRQPSAPHAIISSLGGHQQRGQQARQRRQERGAHEVGRKDGQRRADRRREADPEVLIVERPQPRTRHRQEHRLPHVRLVERRHRPSILDVGDRIAADVGIGHALPDDARRPDCGGERRHVPCSDPRPRRMVECPVLADERVEPEQPAVQRDRDRQRVRDRHTVPQCCPRACSRRHSAGLAGDFTRSMVVSIGQAQAGQVE